MSARSASQASEDDMPVSKRSRLRVTKACEECRRRKEKCDGGHPFCQRCIKAGHRTCSYHQGRKRGLRTGYVRGVEILLGLLIHSFDGAEDLIASVLHRDPQLSGSCIPNISAPCAGSLLESWRKSTASEGLQRVLTASGTEVDEESYLQDLDRNLTANFNDLLRHQKEAEEDVPDTQLPSAGPLASAQFPHTTLTASSNEQRVAPVAPVSDLVTATSPPLPRNWSHLIDIYMTYTHSWLPVIEKYTLLRSASLLGSDLNAHNNQSPTPGEIVSLWAALAHGAYVSEAAGSAHSSSLTCSTGDSSFSHVFTVAKKFAVQDRGVYEHGDVHAFLILALLDVARSSWTGAWLWVGRAVYVAATLDIIPFEKTQQGVERSEISKRLFTGCFVLDALTSASLGYRPYLNRADLQSLGSHSIEGLEEWEIWRPAFEAAAGRPNPPTTSRALSTFVDLGYVAGILNELNRMPLHTSTSRPSELLRDLLQRQENLLAFTPTPFPEQSPLESGPCHQVHLRLATASIYLLLCARIRKMLPKEAEMPPNEIPSSLIEMIRLLESTPKGSPAFGRARLPPTAGIFFHLLEQSRVSCSVFPSSTTWNGAEQQANTAGIEDAPPIPQRPSQGNTIGAAAQSNGENASHEQALELAPGTAGQQVLGVSNPIFNANQSRMPISMQISQSTNHPIRSVYDLSAPISASSRDTALTMQEPNRVAHSEGAGDSRLFSQLSLLDSADWPEITEDFMVHLGFSRNEDGVGF